MRWKASFAALALTVALVTPVSAESSGSIPGVVIATDPGPCITVNGSLDYGTRPFLQGGIDAGMTTPFIPPTVFNCNGNVSAQLFMRATDASGDGDPAATWSLHQQVGVGATCSGPDALPLNQYALVTWGPKFLSQTDQLVATINGGSSANAETRLIMPCVGSDGINQTMTFAVLVTAAAVQ